MDNMMRVKKVVLNQGNYLTQAQQDWLTRPYLEKEVKEAIFNIPSTKAQGLDGYSSYFIQDNWDIVDDEGLPQGTREAAYLSGKSTTNSPGSIAWDNLWKSKARGGLGFKNSHYWNEAAIGKHVWALETYRENLWVKWIHHAYLKNENWFDYKACQQSSWYWRKIIEVKEKMKTKMDLHQLTKEEYNIKKISNFLAEDHAKMYWKGIVWANSNVPNIVS
ncbi:unnamed protein product [Vicia faba]|uniref:Uncharacterized protein n=1 Tax=Vicia faba TaxID=3906 RepID=A0AAV0ZIX3_VICFA|nr:unnamed protein product [Vicia faba]